MSACERCQVIAPPPPPPPPRVKVGAIAEQHEGAGGGRAGGVAGTQRTSQTKGAPRASWTPLNLAPSARAPVGPGDGQNPALQVQKSVCEHGAKKEERRERERGAKISLAG